jgi:CDP-glucose 4,6-dehydratase
MGTINVLEASRKSESVKVVIIVTSDKCYENNGWIWGYRENDSLGGYDPYSSSKACTELVTSSYINSYFNKGNNEESDVGVASVRAGNVIGGGDWAKDRLITDCIISLKKGNTIEIRSPKAIRPWQHVLEPIRGYMLLALKLHKDQTKYKGSWNFGPDNSSIVTVGELVDKILKVWGAGKWIDVSNDNNLHEANFLKLDASKAKFHLGWETQLNIDESIQLLVNWYKQYEEENVYQLCVNQINDYIEKIN